MGEKIRNLMLYGGVSREDYEHVKKDILHANRHTAMVFSAIACILIAMMALISMFQESLSGTHAVYILGTVGSAVIFMLAYCGKYNRALIYVSMYLANCFFLMYGLVIGVVTRPQEQTVTFMVLLLLLPLIFVDRPIRTNGLLLLFIILFIAGALHTKTGAVLSVDITDAIIFGILAMASGTVVICVKIRSYVLERQLHIMSETDQLTGLNNRNSYEWRLKGYLAIFTKSICCVYIDVNGLHTLNNTKGHKTGDEMLQYIAAEIQKLFGIRDTYRIGGDEYVAFVLDADEEDIKKMIAALLRRVSERSYHIAVGYEYQTVENVDMNQLIIQAESKMYKDKSEYYRRTNGNR